MILSTPMQPVPNRLQGGPTMHKVLGGTWPRGFGLKNLIC